MRGEEVGDETVGKERQMREEKKATERGKK